MSRSDNKSLLLCVHAHQPVGNFEEVFERAYERSYKPFFEAVESHPSVRWNAHFSGSLLDWLENRRPEFFERINRLVSRGQLEILGGAYYEPVYGAIPRADLEGQLSFMSEKLGRLFGAKPEGVWLTERVWDPELAGTLSAAGVGYTVLDDFHLGRAEAKNPVTGLYSAVKDGASLDVYASLQALRYLMPFRKAEESVRFVEESRFDASQAIVFADDCEKFGLWPGTQEWVFGADGWLERFLSLIEARPHIRTYTMSVYRREHPASRSAAIPHSSYAEMMSWCGGSFQNFFDRYPESRYMRDRMLAVSRRLDRLGANNGHGTAYAEAKLALYRAQCNCPYWHGVFGGLYLHHLRSEVFANLIRAEKLADAHDTKQVPAASAYRLESGERWRVRSRDLTAFFDGTSGAAMEELDFLPAEANLTCTLARRPEAYHAILGKKKKSVRGLHAIHSILGAKEPGLERELAYDAGRRLSFVDRFFERPVAAADFAACRYREAGDFAGGDYDARLDASGAVRFERAGVARLGTSRRLRVVKTVDAPSAGAMRVRYQVRNQDSRPAKGIFGVELNFSVGPGPAQAMENPVSSRLCLEDLWRAVSVEMSLSPAMGSLVAPIHTVSESESGMERTYQETAVLFTRPFELGPGEVFEQEITLEATGERRASWPIL